MNFNELIQKRYSVRAYCPDPIEPEKLDMILQAARLAPTAANRQPFQLLVIHTDRCLEELKSVYDEPWFIQAPIIIGICSLPSKAWIRSDGKNYADVDAAIVMDHIILAATDLGIGTCWIGAFDPDAARKAFGLPAGVEPVAFTPVGYPADQLRTKIRRPIEKLAHMDQW